MPRETHTFSAHVDLGTLPRVSSRTDRGSRWPGPESRSDRSVVVHRRLDPDGLLGGAFSGVRRDSSYSSGGKTEDSLGRACVGPPRDDATAHRTWDHGRRSSSSSSSIPHYTLCPTTPHTPLHPMLHYNPYPTTPHAPLQPIPRYTPYSTAPHAPLHPIPKCHISRYAYAH